MIHYHGTPIGGPRQDTARFLRGRHALVPFGRQDDLGAVAELCQSFCFDNGAFTAWKQGRPMDVEGYLRWVEEWSRHPGFDWALIPDVIDGSEDENDGLLADWPSGLSGVPVWHLHESLERFERLSHEWRIVALGSSGQWPTPGTDGWWGRMADVMAVVCEDGKPRCKLHGLRMLNPSIFSRLPLASADSTNAAQNAGLHGRFGMYVPATQAQRLAVIADRIESYSSAAIWAGVQQEEFAWGA